MTDLSDIAETINITNTTSESEPEPLAQRMSFPEYPVEALGPILGEAAKRLAYFVQTPISMAGQSVLSAAALSVQGHINVDRAPVGESPVSLYCLTVARSGERKSTLDKMALRPLREYETELRKSMQERESDYMAEMEAWKLQRKAAEAEFNNSACDDQERKEFAAKIAQIESSKPKPPYRPNLTFEEPTAEGIYRHLKESNPTAGLFSDEGISFFGGHGMSDENRGRTIGCLSKLWDGSPLTRTRGSAGESDILAGRRLSAHLMVQPVIADKLLKDQLLMEQGFLARFLVSQDTPIVGYRFLANRDLTQRPEDDPAITRFWQILGDWFRAPLPVDENGELVPNTLSLEGDAQKAWVALHDAIESRLAKTGAFTEIDAMASKAAENAARIAAIFCAIEGTSSPSPDHIDRAGQLVDYYLNNMLARLNELQEDSCEIDARDLLEWIRENGGTLLATDFKRLPPRMRSARYARGLIDILVGKGHLVVAESKQSGKGSKWKIREVNNDN